MSTGMLVLTVVAVLVFFGVAQRVLDRMRLTDRQALLLVAAMFVGTLLPNVELGQVSLNLGGAVIPLGVCIYLLFTCGDGKEVGRTLVGTVLTAAAVYALSVFLPDEPEQMWIVPICFMASAEALLPTSLAAAAGAHSSVAWWA